MRWIGVGVLVMREEWFAVGETGCGCGAGDAG